MTRGNLIFLTKGGFSKLKTWFVVTGRCEVKEHTALRKKSSKQIDLISRAGN
jgi:hypothetical protein